MSKPRYTTHMVDDYTPRRIAWGIWDHEQDAWADDLGRFLTEEGAKGAIAREIGEDQKSCRLV